MSKKRNSKRNPRNKKKSGNKKKSRQEHHEHQLKQQIIAFFKANKSKKLTVKQLTRQADLWSQTSNNKLRSVLDRLVEEGRLAYVDKGRYTLLETPTVATGQLQVTRSGAGFMLVDEGEDIYIRPNSLGKAMNGDIIKVRLVKRRKSGGRPEGEVVEIIKRGQTMFVGVVEEGLPGKFFLLPDDRRITVDFFIPNKHLNGARADQKVLAKLLRWEHRSPEVEVLQILGEAGEHNTEMHAILLQYDFSPNFPAEVNQEADQLPGKIPAEEIKKRRDFRKVTTFTIDPADAKDFDDALSIRPLENGIYEVGIHIADVSWYVKPGTAIDREGFRRGTSVYLVDRTVPMLPERLSNNLCSLRPEEDKLTYSVVVKIDRQGKVHDYWIGRTIIHSDKRFDYAEAQEVLEGKADGPFQDELQTLWAIASKLRKERFKKGSIEFETDEVKFELDEEGRPLKVIRKKVLDTMRLIEDFMLLANRTVATHVHNIFPEKPLPFVYRIHDLPDAEKLGNLQAFVTQFGHNSNLQQTGNKLSNNLNQLLKSVQGRPEQNVIESIAIRSMSKAVYSIHNVGHFGLGFPYYTHFTSPIRRYPDLMVHRLLTLYGNEKYAQNPVVLEEQCQHCSDRERIAVEAERASVKYKQVEFLEERIGQQFSGIISGVIEAGFFVELEENLCEGFVSVASLDDDYYVYEAEKYQLKGNDTGRILRLGDRVKVEIAETDLQRRRVEMLLIEKLGEKTKEVEIAKG